jgi:flagellar motor switch protein FliG
MPVAAPVEEAAQSGRSIAQLSKVQRLAALFVILGPDSASQILKGLEPKEIETISTEMSQFGLISHEEQDQILAEFSDLAVEASTSLSADVECARSTLEKAVGPFKASDIMSRVAPNRTPSVMQGLAESDSRHIYNLIRHEQVQTMAFILSYLPSDKAAQIFALLPTPQRDQVIERMATLAPTPVEVMEQVLNVLKSKMDVKQTRALTQSGGVGTAASILNAIEKNSSKALLLSVEERNPELAQEIRKKMFTFEDLLTLGASSIQRIMREADMADLAVALKKSSDPLKKLLLGSISRRAAQTVEDEIAYMGSVKAKDIEAAQLRIIEVVRKLEADGEIDLNEAREEQYAAA